MTKFSGTLRSVSQNFSLAAIYDAEIANNSANLQKIPMFDLNADEKHIAFAKFSEKHRLFHLLYVCDMKSNDRFAPQRCHDWNEDDDTLASGNIKSLVLKKSTR